MRGNNKSAEGNGLFIALPFAVALGEIYMGTNARYQNGALRRKNRARLKAMGGPCGICKGRLGPIHYDEPSDFKHPLSFVVDEKIPISRWKEFGYSSPRDAAEDWNNLQAAHYCCNAIKSNKIGFDLSQKAQKESKINISDGSW